MWPQIVCARRRASSNESSQPSGQESERFRDSGVARVRKWPALVGLGAQVGRIHVAVGGRARRLRRKLSSFNYRQQAATSSHERACISCTRPFSRLSEAPSRGANLSRRKGASWSAIDEAAAAAAAVGEEQTVVSGRRPPTSSVARRNWRAGARRAAASDYAKRTTSAKQSAKSTMPPISGHAPPT